MQELARSGSDYDLAIQVLGDVPTVRFPGWTSISFL